MNTEKLGGEKNDRRNKGQGMHAMNCLAIIVDQRRELFPSSIFIHIIFGLNTKINAQSHSPAFFLYTQGRS